MSSNSCGQYVAHTFGLPEAIVRRLLTVADIARLIGEAPRTVASKLAAPGAPLPLAVLGARSRRYNAAEVLAWLHADALEEWNGEVCEDGCSAGHAYGLPGLDLTRLWQIADIAQFAQVEKKKARDLMNEPDAPPRLRLGSQRCDRWNPAMVVAHLHGGPWQIYLPGYRPDLAESASGHISSADHRPEIPPSRSVLARLDALLASG